MYSELPTNLPQNGVVGFGLNGNVTLDGVYLPAGTRFTGYMNASIGHFVGIYNGNNIVALRYAARAWSLLYSVRDAILTNSLINESDTGIEGITGVRNGKIVQLNILKSVTAAEQGWYTIGTLPSSLRPASTCNSLAIDNGISKFLNSHYTNLIIRTNGTIEVYMFSDKLSLFMATTVTYIAG